MLGEPLGNLQEHRGEVAADLPLLSYLPEESGATSISQTTSRTVAQDLGSEGATEKFGVQNTMALSLARDQVDFNASDP